MSDRVVLAYSGGLDTAVAAHTLRTERGLDVVAAFVDLGQPFDLDAVQARAAAAGAELRLVDARAAFAEGFCLPALHANALYEGKYPLVSALARPLIAAEVVRIARETGARFVAHGCTGKGNDQVRFETAFADAGVRPVDPGAGAGVGATSRGVAGHGGGGRDPRRHRGEDVSRSTRTCGDERRSAGPSRIPGPSRPPRRSG